MRFATTVAQYIEQRNGLAVVFEYHMTCHADQSRSCFMCSSGLCTVNWLRASLVSGKLPSRSRLTSMLQLLLAHVWQSKAKTKNMQMMPVDEIM